MVHLAPVLAADKLFQLISSISCTFKIAPAGVPPGRLVLSIPQKSPLLMGSKKWKVLFSVNALSFQNKCR